MKVLSKNHSSYPRVGENHDQQKLRRAYNQLDKGKIKPAEVKQILDETIETVIKEQLKAGCDLVTDGQIRTFDPLSYLAARMDGFEIAGLLRFFDTNFLYRQPRIIGKLGYREPLIAEDHLFTRKFADGKASAVMFGPYSFLKMSLYDGNFDTLLADLTGIYIRELRDLKANGASMVQLDEPAIVHNPDDLSYFKATYEKIAGEKGMPDIMLSQYFGNAAPLVDKIQNIPVKGFAFDFTYSRGLDDTLKGFNKDIGLGIIDGRNTKMEKVEAVVKRAEAVMSKVDAENIYITSSCGLEFLPRDRAFDKLKLCADSASKLSGGNR